MERPVIKTSEQGFYKMLVAMDKNGKYNRRGTANVMFVHPNATWLHGAFIVLCPN